ncbi:Major facilitator superfamily domain containing protein [Amanita muscaria]
MADISEEPRQSLSVPSSCSSGTAVHISSAIIASQPDAVKEKQTRCTGPPHRNEGLVTLVDQTNLLPLDKIITVFLSLGLCIIVSAFDSVVVATALPTISEDFEAGTIVSWVPAAFLLTSTSFQPLYGRFSDIFGRKASLSISMVVFMIGNLISGFSRSITQLIIARGISGAGGGGIISMCQIIISDIVTLRERGKYQGIIGVIIALGYTMGPIVGGALSQDVSWRWCFWFSIPISLVATCIVLFVLPLQSIRGRIREKLLIMDFFGAFLCLVGSTLILLPLIWGGVTFPWRSPEVLVTFFCGLVVTAGFTLWEWMCAKLPIVPMYIFRHSTVIGVYITMFVNGFVFFSSIYYVPQYLQIVMGDAPFKAGIFLLPYLIGQMVASLISGMLVSITGKYRVIIHTGFALWSIACGLLSTITPHSPRAVLVVYMLFAGIGAGQTLQTTTVAAQASVTRQDVSVVTAFRNFIRQLGGALSLAIGSTIINNALRDSMTDLKLEPSMISALIDKPSVLASPASVGLSHEDASFILFNGYTRGFRYVFIINACWTAIATAASVLMIKQMDLTDEGDSSLTRQGEKSAC